MLRNEADSNGEEPLSKKPKIMAKRKLKRKLSHTTNKKVKKNKTLPKNFAYFPELPPDLQQHVASFFSFDDFPNTAVTSKGFYHLANGPQFWLNKLQKHFPNEFESIMHSRNLNWDPVFPHHPKQRTFASLFKARQDSSNENLTLDIQQLFHIIKEGCHQDFDPNLFSLDDLYTDNNDGDVAARLAAAKGHQPLLDMFYKIALDYFKDDEDVEAYDPDKTNDRDQNLLHWAILCKQPIDHIATLIALGFDVNFPDDDNVTPLHFAAISNYPAAINLLLERGATHDVTDANEYSPLHLAADYGNIASIQALLAHRVEVDALNNSDETPLMRATGFGHTACVKLLIRHGANIHLSCEEGGRPLNFATYYGHIDLVKVLVDAGANITARASKNRTVLETAIERNFHECLDYFIGRNFEFINELSRDAQPLLTVAARAGYRHCIQALVNRSANVNEVSHGDHSTTALQQAALNGYLDCVALLVESGASVDLVCEHGYTALLAANENGNVDCVRYLLELGANPNYRKTSNDMTALMTASIEGHGECMRLLLDAGADIDARNTEDDWTALFYAVNSNNLAGVKLLHERGANLEHTVKTDKARLQEIADAERGSSFRMFAVLRKMIDVTTITAEELAKMLGHKQIAEYLENSRVEKLERDVDALRAFW